PTTPVPTPSVTATTTPTVTPVTTPTATPAPSVTPTSTVTPTASPTAIPTATATPSITPTSTATPSTTPTALPTQQPTHQSTLLPPPDTEPVTLSGSDGRLEAVVPRASFDLSQAQQDTGALPEAGGMTLQITQLHGHYVGESTLLGYYQLQV